jgi:hypothetical protein
MFHVPNLVSYLLNSKFTMDGLDPSTQPPRVCAANDSRTRELI